MEPELYIAVCDDTSGDKEQMVSLTEEIMVSEGISCGIDAYSSGKELLTALQNGKHYQILLPTDYGYHRISIKDIQFVEAFDRGTRFMLDHQLMISKWKFSEALEVLPKSVFLQCHRAFLVNLSQVISIRNYEFILKSKVSVPISKDRYTQIYKTFTDYLND